MPTISDELDDSIKVAVGEMVKARQTLAKSLVKLSALLEQAGVRWDDGPKYTIVEPGADGASPPEETASNRVRV